MQNFLSLWLNAGAAAKFKGRAKKFEQSDNTEDACLFHIYRNHKIIKVLLNEPICFLQLNFHSIEVYNNIYWSTEGLTMKENAEAW